MVKQKTFSAKLTGNAAEPVTIREESDDEDVQLRDIPTARDNPDLDSVDDFESGAPLQDDKKRLAFNTAYDGFNIWGFVLCLLVERKGAPSRNATGGNAQALMEEWISTQQDQKDDV
jgi:hypothetical protein